MLTNIIEVEHSNDEESASESSIDLDATMNDMITDVAFSRIGRIIVADDLKINLELIKLNLAEVGVTENITYCSDGEIAIKTALGLL